MVQTRLGSHYSFTSIIQTHQFQAAYVASKIIMGLIFNWVLIRSTKKKKKVQAPRSLKYLLTKNTLFCSAQRNQNQFHTTSPNLWEQSLSSLTASDQIRNTFKNSNLLKSNSESCNLLANVFEQNKSLKRVISWVINLFL